MQILGTAADYSGQNHIFPILATSKETGNTCFQFSKQGLWNYCIMLGFGVRESEEYLPGVFTVRGCQLPSDVAVVCGLLQG